MRLLISVILTAFFFLSSQDLVADGKNGSGNQRKEIRAQEISTVPGYDDISHAFVSRFILRTTSSQYRTGYGINSDLVYLPLSACKIIDVAERTTRASSHCVSIGQKLLYPKHYFW